jgi:hypothetical protein
MNRILELLHKFSENNASPDELKELLQALESNDDALKMYLQKEYKQERIYPTIFLSDEESCEHYARIWEKANALSPLQQRKSIFSLSKFRWMAAATMAGIIVATAWAIHSFKAPAGKIVVQQQEIRLLQLTNPTNKAVPKILPDGTVVTLEPGSAISFNFPFIKSRDISITGMARFEVATDAGKPLSVYAHGIATTALGTAFTVNTDSGHVKIQLLEGKIVVRSVCTEISMHDTYLQPGEQISIDDKTGRYLVNRFIIHPQPKSNLLAKAKVLRQEKPNSTEKTLVFNKTPLVDVFTRLEDKFAIPIRYNRNDLESFTFTGSYADTDSLQVILDIICNMNDLHHKLNSNEIVITK